MCDVRAQPFKSKASAQSSRNTTSSSSNKIISSQPALLTITHPFNPLSRGESSTLQIIHYPKESNAPISPLERGRGCVTYKHSHLKSKASAQSSRNTTSSNSNKIISSQPVLLTITHPLIPSQEGNPSRHKPLITNKNAASNLPSREGLSG